MVDGRSGPGGKRRRPAASRQPRRWADRRARDASGRTALARTYETTTGARDGGSGLRAPVGPLAGRRPRVPFEARRTTTTRRTCSRSLSGGLRDRPRPARHPVISAALTATTSHAEGVLLLVSVIRLFATSSFYTSYPRLLRLSLLLPACAHILQRERARAVLPPDRFDRRPLLWRPPRWSRAGLATNLTMVGSVAALWLAVSLSQGWRLETPRTMRIESILRPIGAHPSASRRRCG
jgi:hypothetical protein